MQRRSGVDKAITTTFMIIASIVTTVMVFNAVLPAVLRSRDALVSMRGRMDDRIKSQIAIIHAAGELDRNALWQDSNNDGNFDLFLWVKNVGAVRVPAVERIDLFFGPEGDFARISNKNEAAGTFPYWEWQVENDTVWNPTATIRITINFSTVLSSQRYFLKVVLPNGVADTYYFSL
jgi:archaellum component FlaG (FlaF/FlaG flagellin family)